jgi:zinc protease
VSTGHATDEVELVLKDELARLSTQGPSASELERAKKTLELELTSELQLLNSSGGEGGRAGQLQRFNHYLGNPGGLPQWFAARRSVSAADVAHAAATWLAPERRATVITRRAERQNAP